MADTKITDLNELTAAVGADVVAIVDDPAGAPETKKITVANLFGSFLEYGGLYTDDGVATQAGIAVGVPVKLALWASNADSTGDVTPDAANDQITLANAGEYLVFLSMSVSGTGNATFEAHVALDGVQQDQAGLTRKFGTGGDVGAAACMGILQVTAGQVLSVLIEKVGGVGTMSLTLIEGQLICLRVA